MTRCRDIMTPDPEFCLPDSSAFEVAKLMKDKNIGSIPVLNSADDRRLVGMVTDRDLVLNVLAQGKNATTTQVSDVMTASPVSCRSDDYIGEAIDLMETHQIRRTPVVDNESKLVGIIAQADVAIRLRKEKKTGKLVEKISQPAMLNEILSA